MYTFEIVYQKTEWKILVYLNLKNMLEYFGIKNVLTLNLKYRVFLFNKLIVIISLIHLFYNNILQVIWLGMWYEQC